MDAVLEILKFTIPGILVIVVAYLLVGKMTNGLLEKVKLEQRMHTKNELLPLRLQAYERLVLLLERTGLKRLIETYNNPTTSAKVLRATMMKVIKEEHTHNLTQQIYVSSQAWRMLKAIKEETLLIINKAYSDLDEGANATDLCQQILEILVENDEIPSEKGIEFLKREVELYFK